MANSTLTNSSARVKGGSPRAAASRFVCLPGCGLCCSYRVLVTKRDRERLEATTSHKDPWEAGADGQLALRRTPEFCLFLDAQRRCRVYPHRPAHCRTYPYLETSYDGVELDVDLSCPGLGQGEGSLPQDIKTPSESEEHRIQRARALQRIRELLLAHRRYASQKWLIELGRSQVDILAAAWYDLVPAGAWTMSLNQVEPARVNVQTEYTVGELRQALRSPHQTTQELLANTAWLDQHFAQPRWNTRLYPAGRVELYRFWTAGGNLHLEQRVGSRTVTPLASIGGVPWESEALVTREAYLRRWLSRQLLRRLATNLAVVALVPGKHLAVTYLQLLLDIDHRLAVLAPALAQAEGKDAVDRILALEAIRGSDGLLRAWCESARLGITD
jgi:Fe-S-cluster containining protein